MLTTSQKKAVNNHDFFTLTEKEILSTVKSSKVGICEIEEGYFLKTILGEPLPTLVSQRYIALGQTTIFSNALGIFDDVKYMNRLVTRFTHGEKEYILVVSSYALENFNSGSDSKKILDIIAKISEKGAEN
jgi:hypothetical protein